MVDLFIRKAEAAGCECRKTESREQAIAGVMSALQAEGVADVPGRWAVWPADGWLEPGDRERIASQLPGVHFEVSRRTATHALVGICGIEYGVAATGTLVSDSSAVERRLVTTLPSIHIALLDVSRIVRNLPEALKRMDTGRRGFIAAITGPSRTADIERVLTIGVHGPRRLLIFLTGKGAGGSP